MKSLQEALEESIPKEELFEPFKSYGDASIKQGTWLTKRLWNNHAWDLKLKNGGVSWTDFMEAYGSVQYRFIKWTRGEQTWEEAMDDLIRAIIRAR